MKTSRGCLYSLVIISLIVLIFGVVRFYAGKYFDRSGRPWAYSETDPLLIGRWKGAYQDPDGIGKTLTLDLFEPEPDAKRWNKAFSTRRRRGRHRSPSKRSFDGKASVVSRLGREEYEIYGSVDEDDYHQIKLSFRTDNSKNFATPNFYLFAIEETHWQGNDMTGKLMFSYRRKDGSSFWSSGDPRFSKRVPISLKRVKS